MRRISEMYCQSGGTCWTKRCCECDSFRFRTTKEGKLKNCRCKKYPHSEADWKGDWIACRFITVGGKPVDQYDESVSPSAEIHAEAEKSAAAKEDNTDNPQVSSSALKETEETKTPVEKHEKKKRKTDADHGENKLSSPAKTSTPKKQKVPTSESPKPAKAAEVSQNVKDTSNTELAKKRGRRKQSIEVEGQLNLFSLLQ